MPCTGRNCLLDSLCSLSHGVDYLADMSNWLFGWLIGTTCDSEDLGFAWVERFDTHTCLDCGGFFQNTGDGFFAAGDVADEQAFFVPDTSQDAFLAVFKD